MLIYTRRAAPKEPKRRSRAGCIHCKEKKKKCNESRPQCDRCMERGLECEYEAVKPRKRRRTSFAGSVLSHDSDASALYNERWSNAFRQTRDTREGHTDIDKWEAESACQYPESEASGYDWELGYGHEHEQDVEEVVRSKPFANSEPPGTLIRTRSPYPDLAMIAPSPVASPLLDFSAPVFVEFSERTNRRALVDHFCNVLSHLIVFKEDTGNPFRQLVLPLSHASSPVMNAIFALSSAHLEYRGIDNEEKSLDFHNRALQGLAKLIENNDPTNREEVLGAIMLLVYYEVLVQRGHSNIVHGHLKGAMTIMKSGPQDSSPTSLFLERAFRFYDVIAALSLGTAPNSSTQPSATPFPFPSSPSPLSSVDTLLGLSTDLWPIIHRLSHLLSYKSSLNAAIAAGEIAKATVLRTELETTSQAIEFALMNWQPSFTAIVSMNENSEPLLNNSSPVEDTRMEGILHNAESYRHSAFVYLYRTIQSLPRDHVKVQRHSHLSLLACSNVVRKSEQCHDGPMSALLWPLFVAACEAMTDDDRELALKAFEGIERKQGMNNIMRAWEVVREVWRRGDEGIIDIDWRDICNERGYSIVFG